MCECPRCLSPSEETKIADFETVNFKTNETMDNRINCDKCIAFDAKYIPAIKKKCDKWVHPRSQLDVTIANSHTRHMEQRANIMNQFTKLESSVIEDPDPVYIGYLIKKIESDINSVRDAYNLTPDDPLFIMMRKAVKSLQ